MTKQRGQSAVEFAFIVPIALFIILGGIYGGILFMDYMNYSNTARQLARDATFKKVEEIYKPALDEDAAILYKPELYIVPKDDLKSVNGRLSTLALEPLNPQENSRTVVILLTRKFNLGLFDFLNFPPESLKPIIYTMPVENHVE